MARLTGRLIICEHCGKAVFKATNDTKDLMAENITILNEEPEEWKQPQSDHSWVGCPYEDLCPECNQKWEEAKAKANRVIQDFIKSV